MKPPLLPSETLTRVLRIARFDGMGVLVVAGGVALLSAAYRDVTGALVGLFVAAAGAIELHGVALLRAHRVAGIRWLVSSQVYLLTIILLYVAFRMARPDITWVLQFIAASPVADIYEQVAAEKGVTLKQYLLTSFYQFYICVAVLTVFYQGGMMLYYLRRRNAVEAALQQAEA
jgi:phosphatidylserine synthase